MNIKQEAENNYTNKMKYKFVKYKTTLDGKEVTSQWMFEPQSIEQVQEFFMKYTMPQKQEADRRISKNISYAAKLEAAGNKFFDSTNPNTAQNRFYGGHPNNNWDAAHYSFYLIAIKFNAGVNPLDINNKMVVEMLTAREKVFKAGIRSLYGEEGLTCQAFDDRFCTIIDEIETDTLIFPNMDRPTIDDVKFIMWDGGKHWYAKIGKLDVVVNGIQKWNTKEEATKAAKQYINENWK